MAKEFKLAEYGFALTQGFAPKIVLNIASLAT